MPMMTSRPTTTKATICLSSNIVPLRKTSTVSALHPACRK